MLNSYILYYKLKNTYRVNSIIYTLKHTPLIKKIFSYSLYNNKGLKTLANVISAIIEFFSIFLGKLLYLVCFIALIAPIYNNTSLAFINILVFLTIVGALLNTNMFNPSVDKYYAINLMRFDAKKYIITNYLYFLIKNIIGMLPFTIIIGLSFKVPLLICILLPLFIVNVKNIANSIILSGYNDNKKLHNENKLTAIVITFVIILLGLAYGLPYINIGINETIFYILFIISTIVGILSFRYILNYKKYTKVSKELLKKDDLIIVDNKASDDKMYKSQITNEEVNSKKEGYAYLNDIFVKRHKKLLTKATKNISIGTIIFFIVAIVFTYIFKESNKDVNDILKHQLPYFMFIMYFINRGQKICQTMFMNCDHSMLTYRFYREPHAILSLFKERLKTLIKLNVIPGVLIAIGTVILLYTTGGATTLEYIITFLSIVAMSIFFSVHYLVLYYLLQPYDVNLEIKNPAFMSICGATYFVCYMASQAEIPTMIFGVIMCLFTVVYSTVSLYLAYKYAPKNFKLRI